MTQPISLGSLLAITQNAINTDTVMRANRGRESLVELADQAYDEFAEALIPEVVLVLLEMAVAALKNEERLTIFNAAKSNKIGVAEAHNALRSSRAVMRVALDKVQP